MPTTLTPWPTTQLQQACQERLPGFSVDILPQIDSTNSELMRRAKAGRQDPVLLLAEHQTAGRGRHGRTWWGRPGDALTFSIGMALRPHNWSGLSLAVGLSLAQSLAPQVQLKWPNDLWWETRKLGGILIEVVSQGAQSYAVVGVGLNVRGMAPEGLLAPFAAADEFLPGVDGGALCLRLVPNLLTALLEFERSGFAPLQAGFEARDGLRGLQVHTSDGMQGVCEGVDMSGALSLRTATGLQPVCSAEVSIKPVVLAS